MSIKNEAKLVGGGAVGSGTIGTILSMLQASGRPLLMVPAALIGFAIMAVWILTVDSPT